MTPDYGDTDYGDTTVFTLFTSTAATTSPLGRNAAIEAAADCVEKRIVAGRAAYQLAPP